MKSILIVADQSSYFLYTAEFQSLFYTRELNLKMLDAYGRDLNIAKPPNQSVKFTS